MLLLLGLSATPGLPSSALAQGADGLSAERSAARLVDTLIRNLDVGSTVVVRPLTGGHTGLPESVAKRIETLVVGTLDFSIPANMEVNLITGDDVHRIYGNLEETSFGADTEKLLASVLRAERADTVLACEPTGADPASFELRCSVTYGEVVCAGGGTDLRTCEGAIEVNVGRSLGAAHAVFPWRNPDEYLDHVFTGLAWEIVRKSGLKKADAVEVEGEGSGTDLGRYVTRSLRREMAASKDESLGWRAVEGEGRRFRLAWFIEPWGRDRYELSVELYEETPGGARYVTGENAHIVVSSLPPGLRLGDGDGGDDPDDGRTADGAVAGPGPGPDASRSPFGGRAILDARTEPPGARVLVGGELAGETPLVRSDLRAGTWTVVLDHPLHETARLEGQELADRRVLKVRYRLVRGRGEVTFDEWDACRRGGGCSHIPGDFGWGRGDRPVVDVSWEDAREYVRWLSGETGSGYRLLSESEWEYVARSGARTRYWWGDEVGRNRANCDGCGSRWDDERTSPAGLFSPNAFAVK